MRASAAPDALAIAGDKQLTYGELNSRARSTGPPFMFARRSEQRFPSLFFWSALLELAIAALAVLKAGGTYVPLDPSYPLTVLRCCWRIARRRWSSLILPWPRNSLQELADDCLGQRGSRDR